MIRAGRGEPLVLLHGVTGSERMWTRVVPLLAPHHDTIALTALGHKGGRACTANVSLAELVDDTERELDDLGVEHAHLAGNSMGGWIALELARRGRALSVCALSPAGCWQAGASDQTVAIGRLRAIVRLVQRTRAILPLVARSSLVRRIAMRDNAVHGDRLTPEELIDLADDLLACTARDDLLSTSEQLAPLDPLPCPVVVAWSGCDRIFPPAINGVRARELMPAAYHMELPGVGHVPMLDDARLVASTILQTTRLTSTATDGEFSRRMAGSERSSR
jgi:pimeloyl-ACP methyl ester carboxylesterase